MPKLKQLREQKGLQAKQVAEAAGIDATMYSRFENYRVLPIPPDLERITEALQCLPTDLYSPDEVRLLPDVNRVDATGGAKAYQVPNEYKMTVRLGNDCREVLTREVLQKCGYKSIGDFIGACIQKLKMQYEAISKKEKPRQAFGDKASGVVEARHTTPKTPTTNSLSKINQNVK